ncbi:malonyl-CoA:anthocyanidin 5-O-glucoside-6''-O-malonyltransferase-like [Gossypium arboreum]|uniref:malonyl-CoA:anthocyanidin 5-O-glucoside-6''-O-malonyltransferase-like n=1 Tax=Gossypium arboreum TaxID=29729 RepID=UPI0022F15236|nr:malonyl-CoA:anthocyanidin 5-O-glucoside-6''-O-malonyltransferase-like [Gossypium arboreum]
MGSSCTVKILEIAQIKPSLELPNCTIEFSLPLTFFDSFWFTFPPVEGLLFYNLNDLTPADFSSEILTKLKQSLSLTLRHYLPVAGSLKWPSDAPRPFILYAPDDGVSVIVAESDADFHRLSSNGIYEAVELHPLIPHLRSSDDSASILAIQITFFPSQGFSIGITAHHTVLEGKTTSMFMKSWAYLCRLGNKENPGLPLELIPYFDREIIKDPTGHDLDILYLNQRLICSNGNKSLKVPTNKRATPNLVRATVTLSQEDFKKMREKVLSKSPDSSKIPPLSDFALTLGYVASCIVKARGGAETYFGNCNVILADISEAGGYMDFENGIAFGAVKVSNMVKGLKEKGVFEGAKDRLAPLFKIAKEPPGSVQKLIVAGSPRFDLYKTDFGWGRPWKVVLVSIDKNEAISMAESRDGNRGIEVGLALKKPEMERFLSMFLKDV